MLIQRGKELGCALPLNKDEDYQSLENLKKFIVNECPFMYTEKIN